MTGGHESLVRIQAAVVEHRARRTEPTKALSGVDFAISPGDCVALLGPNGSGKSTLLRAIAGLQRLTSGSIKRSHDLRLGVVFQSPALDPLLTVHENLRLQAALFGIDRPNERIERFCAEQAIDGRLGDRVRSLSGGLARRVEFVRAILSEPDLLLLDEPTVGLDLPSRAALLGAIDVLRGQRPEVAVVMSTHLMTDAERFEQVVMMSGGKFVREGSPTELIAQLGSQLLGVPAGASVGAIDVPWELQADGTRIARPADDAQLASWSAQLAGVGVPFFVRKPTLADAYLHWAEAPLEAGVPA